MISCYKIRTTIDSMHVKGFCFTLHNSHNYFFQSILCFRLVDVYFMSINNRLLSFKV